MTRSRLFTVVPAGLLALALVACSSSEPVETPDAPPAEFVGTTDGLPVPAAPILLTGTAYETASSMECIDATPENWDDLHNVLWLSDNIVSGSEPATEAAYERISKMGVKTILSTDGKAPDPNVAAKFGMRYVHVPIQYSGMTESQIARIAKTFRELEGPFFVHCFHGKHRGPAGAAVGRLVLDGASREEALAQMVQCGTSKKYEGLYRAIATAEMPSAEETAALQWDFPAQHPFEGERKAMIEMARHWDNVVLLGKRKWEMDPAHPDLDALNEAEKLHGLFQALSKSPDVATEPDDYKAWLSEGLKASTDMVAAIRAYRTGDAEAAGRAETALNATKKSCSDCHDSYRN